jgi:hypothetical protein
MERANANAQRALAAIDKAKGRKDRKINTASWEADNLRINAPGSSGAKKAEAKYTRLKEIVARSNKTLETVQKADQRLRPLDLATRGAWGLVIAKAKVRKGASRSLLEPVPGDRIRAKSLIGVIGKLRKKGPGVAKRR